jgi:hypothetical protein
MDISCILATSDSVDCHAGVISTSAEQINYGAFRLNRESAALMGGPRGAIRVKAMLRHQAST